MHPAKVNRTQHCHGDDGGPFAPRAWHKGVGSTARAGHGAHGRVEGAAWHAGRDIARTMPSPTRGVRLRKQGGAPWKLSPPKLSSWISISASPADASSFGAWASSVLRCSWAVWAVAKHSLRPFATGRFADDCALDRPRSMSPSQ